MTISLTKVTPKYENILAMGDFNIDIKCKGVGSTISVTFVIFSI